IATSGCLSGEVARNVLAERPERARAAAEELATIFADRFYFEIQDNHLPAQERVNAEVKRLAREMGLPLVATNDCHYLHRDHAAAHEVLLCVQTGKTFSDERRWRFETDQLYVKTPEEMAAAFADVPGACANTLAIARRCDFEFKQRWRFPAYRVPDGQTLEEALAAAARAGLDERLNAFRTLAATAE